MTTKVSKNVIIGWAILIVIAVVTSFFGIHISKNLKDSTSTQNQQNEVFLPEEQGQINNVLKDSHSVILLSSPFFPPKDIYTNQEVYKKNLIQVALIGDFENVQLKVIGNIQNNVNNFLSINIGHVSGVLGGYRSGIKTLDLDKTTGIFNKQNPINFTLNLREPTKLSTTQNEFAASFSPTKDVVIWDEIKPSPYSSQGTIANFLVVPYSEDGKYGNGVSIDNIELIYTCKGGGEKCAAALCDKAKKYSFGSECIKDNFEKSFGKSSWENYSKNFIK